MEWVKRLIYAAMLSEAVLMIMPSGKMKKYVRFTAGIMITLMILGPLSSCTQELTPEEIIEQAYTDCFKNID